MTEEELMLTKILDCSRTELWAYDRHKNLTDAQKICLEGMKNRRLKGEPLQYILEQSNFMDLFFKVDNRVLIPRPETEILVDLILNKIEEDLALKAKHRIRILDLGTGSGNIAISLAHYIKNACITAVDTSKDALNLAKINAVQNNVENQIEFLNIDMFKYLKKHNSFDIIVSNPPYIPRNLLNRLPEDVKKEPVLALDGGDEGIDFYSKIIDLGQNVLNNNGYIFLEIGDDQTSIIKKFFVNTEFSNIEVKKDYTNTDRIIWAQING